MVADLEHDACVDDPPFTRIARLPADRQIPALVRRAVRQVLGSRRDGLQAGEWLRAAAEGAHAAGEPTSTYGLRYARQIDGDTDADLAGATRLLATSTCRRLARGPRRSRSDTRPWARGRGHV